MHSPARLTDADVVAHVLSRRAARRNPDTKVPVILKPGKDGKDGADGKDGRHGVDGKDGLGVDGKDGLSGRDGRDGVDAVGKQGPKGDEGPKGDKGFDGWTPLLAAREDGERVVLQVIGWVGGDGDSPRAGLYIGATGLVLRIEDATNIRGPAGTGLRFFGGDGGTAVLRHVKAEADYEVPSGVDIVYCDNAADIVVTLPAATASSTRVVYVKRRGAGKVRLQSQVEGLPSIVLDDQWDASHVHSDGNVWSIIS